MGSRGVTLNDLQAVETIANICRRVTGVIVSGGARGVDTLARDTARKYKKNFKEFPVESFEWNTLGKRSGHIRNGVMAYYIKEHGGCAYIFPKEGEKNAGTMNMIQQCQRLDIQHKVIWIRKNG